MTNIAWIFCTSIEKMLSGIYRFPPLLMSSPSSAGSRNLIYFLLFFFFYKKGLSISNFYCRKRLSISSFYCSVFQWPFCLLLEQGFVCIYYICNPLTKQWSTIPRAPSLRFQKWTMVGLVCYPYFCDEKGGCMCTIGDWYSFKLVHIPKHSDNWYVLTADIFCYESGKWSQRRVFTRRILNSLSWFDYLVAYRGILHWVNCGRSNYCCRPLEKAWRPIY